MRFYQRFETKEEQKKWIYEQKKNNDGFVHCFDSTAHEEKLPNPYNKEYVTVYTFKEEL